MPDVVPDILTSGLLSAVPGVVHGFTGRRGGVSPFPESALNLGVKVGDDPANVMENLRRVAACAGFDPARLARENQVHGDRVVVRTSPGDLEPVDADGQVTNVPGLVVCVFTADCVPVLIADPVKGCVAAVHAGWRGTVARILGRAVAALTQNYGSRPEDLAVAIGPAIGPESFEVGDEVAAAFDETFGDAGLVIRSAGEKPHVDLFAANRLCAREAGVPEDRVDVLGIDTFTAVDRFFSHRAESGRTGRQMAFIARV